MGLRSCCSQTRLKQSHSCSKKPPQTCCGLRKRFEPKEMTRVGVYPDIIWERGGRGALKYVLAYYEKLVAFYKLAAQRGQAVIFAIS